jgi:hypothetical protein
MAAWREPAAIAPSFEVKPNTVQFVEARLRIWLTRYSAPIREFPMFFGAVTLRIFGNIDATCLAAFGSQPRSSRVRNIWLTATRSTRSGARPGPALHTGLIWSQADCLFPDLLKAPTALVSHPARSAGVEPVRAPLRSTCASRLTKTAPKIQLNGMAAKPGKPP